MKKLFYGILFVCILVTTVSSCKKDKKTTTTTITPPAGVLQIWSNVHIIDSTQWILHVGNGAPANGDYNYTFTPSTPNINVNKGDILVGTANGGYLRKVASTKILSASSGIYQISTVQATLADLFKSGSFSFQIPVNDTAQGSSGVSRIFSNLGLYRSSSYNIDLLSGQLYIQPICNFSFSFDSAAGLTNFQVSTNNMTVRDSLFLEFNGLVPYNSGHDTSFNIITINSIQQVQAWTPTGNVLVPVAVKLALSLLANTGFGSAVEAIDTKVTWSGSNIFTGGLQYQGGQWQATNNSISSNFVAIDTFSQLTNASSTVNFISQISSYLYGVAGPQISVGLVGNIIQAQYNSVSPYYRRTDAWTVSNENFTASPLFGNMVSFTNNSVNTDSVFFQTPYQITKIAGDNQTDSVVYTLPQPLVIKVTDSNGQPVSGITVTFTASQGGTLSASTLLTDQNGLAQVTWKLGIPMGTQNVTVKAFIGINLPMLGSPLIFTATGV